MALNNSIDYDKDAPLFKCGTCLQYKLADCFYKCSRRKSGIQYSCKECTDIRKKAYNKTPEGLLRNRIAVKKHRKTPEGRLSHTVCNLRYYATDGGKKQKKRSTYFMNKKYPLANSAHQKVHYALSKGSLIKGCCSVCGIAENIEAHHEDYKKPYDVTWYCVKCHADYHLKVQRNFYEDSGKAVII